MTEFYYVFMNEKQEVILKENLPILLNIGTQFEKKEGTYEVFKIIKDKADWPIMICARQINTSPWLLGHLDKSQYFVMTKNLPL